MKVQCEKCGESFDYEKRSGICPKCNRYMSPKTRQANVQEMPANEKIPTQNNREVIRIKKSSRKRVLPIIFLCILIVCPIYTFMRIDRDVEKIYSQRKYTEDPTIVESQADGFSLGDSFVKIEKGSIFETDHMEKADGYKYISFPYYMEDRSDFSEQNRIYMKVEGKFYRAISDYELLEEGYEEAADILSDSGLTTWLDGGNNYCVFAVPETSMNYELFIQQMEDGEPDEPAKVMENHLLQVAVEEVGNE